MCQLLWSQAVCEPTEIGHHTRKQTLREKKTNNEMKKKIHTPIYSLQWKYTSEICAVFHAFAQQKDYYYFK